MGDLWHGLTTSDFDRLARQYGTPFYLYDADVVARRIARVRRAFRGLVDVYFAVKANPNLALLRALRPLADGLDISSGGELEQAAQAGYDMGRLSFAGPAKTTKELEAALHLGVGYISVESSREVDELVRLARATDTRAPIVLRINPRLKVKEYGMKMGGRPTQFGIDEEDVVSAISLVQANANALAFKGVHVYAGSQCFDVAGIVASVCDTVRLAGLVADSGLPVRAVNFGGGFGYAQDYSRRELDVEAAGEALVTNLQRFRDKVAPDCRLIFELGRFLVADAGIYVTRVVGTKNSRGSAFVIADGGLNHNLSAAGTFGVGLRRNFPLINLSRPDARPITCYIAGPSCNPTDLLGVNVQVAAPARGDLLGVEASGSYGYTASPLMFLGHATPPELVRSGDDIALGRRSRSILDLN